MTTFPLPIAFSIVFFVFVTTIAILAFLYARNGNYKDNRLRLLEKENAVLRDQCTEQEKTLAVAREKYENMQKTIRDWEKTKEEFLQISKLTGLEAGKTIGANILKQQALQTKQTQEQIETRFEKSTHTLHENYKDLFASVKILRNTLQTNTENVDTLKQALSASSSVGYAAETILENVLKSFGLQEGRDYHLQYTLKHAFETLRPDAIVFLPADNILVIDSKATKFLYDLAQGEKDNDPIAIQQASNGIKSSMEKHMKDLAKKDYGAAIKRYLKRSGKPCETITITTILWLPTDNTIEKLRQLKININPSNITGKNDIFICGPTALWAVIGVASQKILFKKQAENYIHILEAAEKLLQTVNTLTQSADKVSRGLGSANKAWSSFTKSFNGKFLSTAKSLNTLGVKTKDPIKKIVTDLLPLAKDTENSNVKIPKM